MFNPQTEYDIYQDKIDVRDFHDYPEDFVVRPPYQRKSVWGTGKQQALLDSLFRRYYIPRLVLREVRLGETRLVREVVDGQQRITTVQRFFADEVKLPSSLNNFHKGLGGAKYSELLPEIRKFVDKSLKLDVDIIKNIDDPRNSEHQRIATEIFWRLQQGESLNFMEVAHARLSSPVRNFLVKYADDITFDYAIYKPVDENPDKHPFFDLIERGNDRMQHLSLMGRLLLVERAGGATDVRDKLLASLIDETQIPKGVGDESYEKEKEASSVLKTLNTFHKIFKDDPSLDAENGIKELTREYFIISVVMLVRHLQKYYALAPELYPRMRDFLYRFHERWQRHREDDRDILIFSDNRQQSKVDLENRDRIIRQAFFEYLEGEGIALQTLDTKRAFNEAEKIRIYRRDEGLCQACLKEGRSKVQATVSWGDYQADHIIAWIKGGQTVEENAQVLCTFHNASKGSK
jgi:5-methylcytosine-specific restriction endonuclease McrA